MGTIKYGWRPDIPDHRDHVFSAVLPPATIPQSVDLRQWFPTAFNQFNLGSCTAQAVAAAIEFYQIRNRIEIFLPSRLFIYYNERVLEGTVNEDAGATLRSGIKCVNRYGVCPEKEWAYDVLKYAVKPPTACYTHALNHQVLAYQRIYAGDLVAMKSCLAQGFPFVFGFAVYESFDQAAVGGIVPMPSLSEAQLGGHAVVAAGYNDSTVAVNGVPPKHFIIRNSWSPRWGVNGYCYMPFEYVGNSNLADDFWSIRQVEAG